MLLPATPTALRFDIRNHLATRCRYAWANPLPGLPSIHQAPDPPGHSPVHLYLVARHGTRWPTKDRMLQMDTLESSLKGAGATSEYEWLKNFSAPFQHLRMAGGELHPIGEQELWSLGARLRQRFPSIVYQSYLPRRYPIISTQVPRAAASATAFASGFLPLAANHTDISPFTTTSSCHSQPAFLEEACSGSSWPQRPQPVAITMAPKKSDPLLRFFDICPAFLHHEDYTERWMATWMTQTLRHLGPKLQDKLHLPRPPNPRDVDALWQLCLAEAGLLGRVDGACGVFDEADVKLLEWVEDVRVWETQGHGAEVNFRMAAPLLADLLNTVQAAANSTQVEAPAKLLFAHAETLVPLASLMGLFQEDLHAQGPAREVPLDEAEYERGQHIVEDDITDPVRGVDSLEDLPLAVHPPGAPYEGPSYFKGREAEAAPIPEGWRPRVPRKQGRMWKGSRVSPYGANLGVVLYRRHGGGARVADHVVRLTYNEQIVPLPGCDGQLDCPLDVFLAVLQPATSRHGVRSACCDFQRAAAWTGSSSSSRSSSSGGGSGGGGGNGGSATSSTHVGSAGSSFKRKAEVVHAAQELQCAAAPDEVSCVCAESIATGDSTASKDDSSIVGHCDACGREGHAGSSEESSSSSSSSNKAVTMVEL